MKKRLPLCASIALSLCACSKQSPKLETTTDQRSQPTPAATPRMDRDASAEQASAPLKPSKQLEIVRDKDEVERLAQAAYRADQNRKSSSDISVRPAPDGAEAVYYKGARIFSAKRVERTDVHPSGHIMILAQLVGDGAVTKAEGVEYTEGQSLDPVGIWVFADGQMRRITQPEGSTISAKFSPSGKRLAVSEYVQNENHQNVSVRCFVVDVATGKSVRMGDAFSGDGPVCVGEWLSESTLRVFVTGEISLEQAITYEIPSF